MVDLAEEMGDAEEEANEVEQLVKETVEEYLEKPFEVNANYTVDDGSVNVTVSLSEEFQNEVGELFDDPISITMNSRQNFNFALKLPK